MKKITACIICKNEEKHIKNCIDALHKYPEIAIVVTDTGSTDQTVPILQASLQEGDLLCHFKWCNDFSAARNYCAMQAKTDWIWLVDADIILMDCHMPSLLNFINTKANHSKIGVVTQKSLYMMYGENTYVNSHEAHIYHRDFFHYEGIIHEQLTSGKTSDMIQSEKKADISPNSYVDLPILIHHLGYETPELLATKCKRNIALLLEEYKLGKDPYVAYQLGNAYATLEEHVTAVQYFEDGLSFDLDPDLHYVQRMVEAYGYSLLELKEYAAALSFEGIYDAFAKTADFVFLMGLIYMNNARFEDAISQFDKATSFSSCSVEGTNSYRALYNKGVILECTNRIDEAIKCYHQCGDFAPAKDRLFRLSGGN